MGTLAPPLAPKCFHAHACIQDKSCALSSQRRKQPRSIPSPLRHLYLHTSLPSSLPRTHL